MSTRSRSVLLLAAPLILSFWMRQLFTFVDTYFAATIGDHAVAGIGLAYPYEFLYVAFWVGTSTGMTSLISRAMGAHEGERFDQILRTTRRIVLVIIPVMFTLGVAIWFFPRAFVADGVAPDVLAQFRIYASVITAGTALTGFWAILPDSIVKAHHDTRATMWAGISSNLLNVGLNMIFIWVFHLGMFGIAFSTVVGRLGGLAYAMRRARMHESERRAKGQDVVPGTYERPYRAIFVLAVPAALAYVLMATESGILNALLAHASDSTASLAAWSIYFRYLMFFVMPIVACGVALLPFTARAWGEHDVPLIRRAFRDVALAGAAYCAILVLPITAFLRGPLVAPLVEAPATRELAEWALLLVPLACLVSIPFFACRPIFEGLQRGAPGLWIAILRYVVLTGPVAWLSVRLAQRSGAPSLHGLVWGVIVVTALVSIVFVAWMQRALRGAERALPATAPAAGSV
jgi:Na+-driven multidrug efflux pump